MNTPEPGEELYLRVKAGFVRQGTSITSYAKDIGITQVSLRNALLGVWNGPKGKAMRRRVAEAANIEAIQ